MRAPSDRQLERHIRVSAKDTGNVIFTLHARQRMRQRHINDPMVLEVLRLGSFAIAPEPDMRNPGLVCRMQRFVAGMQVAVVVVTVMDVKKD